VLEAYDTKYFFDLVHTLTAVKARPQTFSFELPLAFRGDKIWINFVLVK
jgi:hypothetical protein